MTEQEYIDYFESLARKHKAIQHTDEVPRFYINNDDNLTQIENAIRNDLVLPCVIIDQYYDDIDRTNDNFRLKVMGGLSILTKCSGADQKDVRRARQEARAIALSFIHRMYYDCRHPKGALVTRRLVPSTMFKGEQVDVIAEIATGWGYPFELEVPTSVAVQADDWLDS